MYHAARALWMLPATTSLTFAAKLLEDAELHSGAPRSVPRGTELTGPTAEQLGIQGG